MNCKGAQGWERRWLVVYKSEIVRRHDTLASGLHSSKGASNCWHLGCILPRVGGNMNRCGQAIFESAGGSCLGCVLMKEILPGSVQKAEEPGKDGCWCAHLTTTLSLLGCAHIIYARILLE